jgi:filamentous hemagglutinin
VQTQLGGFVGANPWLATGPARVILNEVQSANPSQIRGYVEVAGQRAEVIIANPAGINVNGGGFLNASRVTLTTGSPVINGGALDGFRVQGGNITVGGAGLDTSTADYTGILARAVQVNAGIWAKELRVTTGANEISADHTSATPIAGTGAAPAYAIDVAQLGGMYAGKIFLIGTETGLGVRNAGVIGASGGELVLQSNGWLTNSGTLQAAGSTHISTAGAVTNTGAGAVISAQGNSSITTGAGLTNEAGAMIVATGTLAVSASGALQNTQATIAGNGAVTVNAAGLFNASGTIASVSGNLAVTTTGATSNTVAGGAAQGGRMSAGGNVTLSNTGLTNTGSTLAGTAITVDTHLQAFNNTGGTVSASGVTTTTVTIDSGALTNTAGLIQSTGALAINTHGQTLTNTNAAGYSSGAGGITSQGAVNLVAGDLNNAAGSIGAKGALTVSAANVSNAGGQIVSESTAGFTTTGFNNSGGQLQAAGNVSVAAGPGAITNTGGLVRSDETVSLTAASVVNSNTSGANQGLEGKNIAITAASVANDSGAIRTSVNATVTSSGSINNNAGLISAGNTATLQDTAAAKTLAITNAGGTVIAGLSLAANAASLGGGNGSLLSQQDLSLTLTSDFSNTGQVIANRDLSITTTGNISNSPTAGVLASGQLQAGRSLTLSANNIDNAYKAVVSGANTTVTAANTLTNRGVIDGVETRINAATLTNIGTGAIYGSHLAIAATTLNNSTETVNSTRANAVIAARDRLDIGAQTLNNGEGALVFSAGTVADVLNIGGSLDAGGHATGQALAVNNSGGTIESLGGLAITAGQINNTNPNFAYTVQTGSASGGSVREYITAQGNFSTADGAWVLAGDALLPMPHGGYLYGMTIGIGFGIIGSNGQGKVVPPGSTYSSPLYQRIYQSPSIDVANPPTDPAYWAFFGLSVPTASPPQDPKPTGYCPGTSCGTGDHDDATYVEADPAAVAAWEAAAAPWLELANRLGAFRTAVAATAIAFDGFREYTQTPQTPVITQSSPGRILSAGAMTLHAANALVNDQSQIIAGGALNITGQAVDNRGRSISVNAQRIGTAYFWSNYNEGCGGLGGCDYNYNAYRDSAYVQDVPQTVTLNAFQSRNFTVPSGTNTQVAAATGASIGTNPTAPGALSAAGVHTVPVNLTVPTTSLFRLNPNPAGGFLIETDPRFANYRIWLGSDYMLAQLALDPNVTQKRLGDGFYEQRLINEQIAQLTGQRFLANYSNEEAQYKALMDAGITYAQQYQLRPGIALSAIQMAQLTSDIVWLVEQEVTLPDGSKTRVLVPQVYVHVKDGDLAPNGALLAGKSVNINLAGDPSTGSGGTMTNSGSVAGRTVVNLTAENVHNLGGRITGDALTVAARNDLNNIGGQIIAATSLSASAGRDLNIVTTTSSASNQTSGTSANSFSLTGIDRVAGLYVSNPGGPSTGSGQAKLVASAGRDANIIAGVISNSGANGSTVISAGNDINLGTVATGSSSLQSRGEDHFLRNSQTADVGSQLQTAGNLSLIAGKDLNAKAANVQAAGDLTASAGNNVNITEGRQTNSVGFALTTAESDLFSSSSTTERRSSDQNKAAGSSLGGKTVTIVSGKDINVKGSNVISDAGTTLAAGNNLSIEAAQNTNGSTSFYEKKESGFFQEGLSYSASEQSTDQKNQGTTAAASTVGSIGGNVTLVADNQYRQVGSNVLAPAGDIAILAKSVEIVEARETGQSSIESKFSQSGLGITLSNPVISALQSAGQTAQMADSVNKTDNARAQAMGSALTALSGYNTYNQVSNLVAHPEQAASIGINISIGSSESQSNTDRTSNTAAGSNVVARGDVTIIATGAGQVSNLTVQGSQVVAGENTTLIADNQVNLLAAQNASSERSTNSGSSASLGIGINFGAQTGFSFNASASSSKGQGSGDDVTYTNTQVQAGNKLNIVSGGDTNLVGAVAAASQVTAQVGGNLNIRSLQDTSTYTETQSSSGGGVSLCIPPFCYGASSVSASFGKGNIDSNYQSVGEQSAIRAGDAGFAGTVGGNTALVGGQITSTDKAVQEGKNSFQTGGTLTTTDIQNQASYSGSGYKFGADLSGALGDQSSASAIADMRGRGMSEAQIERASNTVTTPGGSAGYGHASGDASSTTTAGISGIAGNAAARTGDAETGLKPIFDKDKVKADIDAQIAITAEFGKQASKAVGDYAQARMDEARGLRAQADREADPERGKALAAQAQALEDNWGARGALRLAAHTLIGGLTGGVGGAAGAAVGTLTAPVVAQALADAGISGPLAQALTGIASTAVGVAVGGTAGGAAAINEVVNNYLNHPELKTRTEKAKACGNGDAAACKSVRELDQLSEERNATIRNGTLYVSAEQGNQILGSMQTTMGSLQDYKGELQVQLEKSSNPQERAELHNQINEVDNNIRQIASLGKDYQYALYEKTNDFKYLAAFAQLSTATSGNELADAFMAGMAATSGGTKKSPTTESTPPPRPPGEIPLPRPAVSKNADGFTELSIPVTPRDAQARLNTVDASGNGKLSPAEAAAAAQTESIFGPMKRYEAPSSGGADAGGSTPSPDFIVTGGSNAGKTVDFMYTTSKLSAKEVEGLNKFYAKNMEAGEGQVQIQKHLEKADIVPVDFRVLTPVNQRIFMNYVKTLPALQQAKIVILR